MQYFWYNLNSHYLNRQIIYASMPGTPIVNRNSVGCTKTIHKGSALLDIDNIDYNLIAGNKCNLIRKYDLRHLRQH